MSCAKILDDGQKKEEVNESEYFVILDFLKSRREKRICEFELRLLLMHFVFFYILKGRMRIYCILFPMICVKYYIQELFILILKNYSIINILYY